MAPEGVKRIKSYKQKKKEKTSRTEKLMYKHKEYVRANRNV